MLKIIWVALGITFSVLFITDLCSFINNPGLYPIGAECCGFWYQTAKHYIVWDVVFIVWGLLGVLPLVFRNKTLSNFILLVHFGFSVLFLALSAFFSV